MIPITSNIILHDDEVSVEFSRSSGPGGQNVNKVSTAVQLRFNVATSPSIPEDVRIRLLKIAGKRLIGDGVIFIQAQRFRTQEQNRVDAINRLVNIIRRAAETPKLRHKTRPTEASRLRRLKSKKHQSRLKQERKSKVEQE